MTPKAALNTLLALLLCIAVGAGVWATRSYNKAITTAAEVTTLREQMADLQRSHRTLAAEAIRRREFDDALRKARAESTHRIETISREDSDDGAYLRQRIPDRVRDAAHSGR